MSYYSQGFRDTVVARVLSSNASVSVIAAEFSVSTYSVYQWLKQYRTTHLPATLDVMDTDDISEKYRRLIEENQRLTTQLAKANDQVGHLSEEVNFLKKVSRYFAIEDLEKKINSPVHKMYPEI